MNRTRLNKKNLKIENKILIEKKLIEKKLKIKYYPQSAISIEEYNLRSKWLREKNYLKIIR